MDGALRKLREERGLSYKKVSFDLGISVSTVYRHETGQKTLSRLEVLGYAKYYGVEEEAISC